MSAAECRLLIVEDDQELREILQRRFVRRGFQVSTAGNAAAAATALGSQTFDVVLLDRTLPDGDALRQLRSWIEQGPPPAFIVLSGLTDVEGEPLPLPRGVFASLAKPCRLSELETIILQAYRQGP